MGSPWTVSHPAVSWLRRRLGDMEQNLKDTMILIKLEDINNSAKAARRVFECSFVDRSAERSLT
jgi:hypothetical protein